MTNLSAFPRILIVGTCTFDGDDATTITLRNMFAGWEKNNIAFLHLTSKTNIVKSAYLTFNLSKFLFGNFKTENQQTSFLKNVRDSRSLIYGVQGAGKSASFKSAVFNFLHTFISAHRALIPYQYPEALDVFIKTFHPDVIYSPLADIRIMEIVNKISAKYSLPVIPHFMDDWQNTMYAGNLFLTIPRIALIIGLKKIMKRAYYGFSISEKMANEYFIKFHKPFYPFMNCVADSTEVCVPVPEALSDCPDGQLQFCYSGGLHLNRHKILLAICEVLQQKCSDHNIKFSFFTKISDWEKYGDEFRKYDFVRYMGFLKPDELMDQLRKQDFLIHVESFEPKFVKYTRLSISTKIPEYLSLNKPILAIGPDNIASIEYLSSNNCALVIGKINDEIITSKINILLSDKIFNDKIGKMAYSLFKKNHEAKQQQILLKEKIMNLVQSSK